MIDRNHLQPVVRQCQILALERSTTCCTPKTTSSKKRTPMPRIDELHLEYPLAGYWMLRNLLRVEG